MRSPLASDFARRLPEVYRALRDHHPVSRHPGTLRCGATLAVALGLALACADAPETPEERVRAVLAAIEEAAEARDVAALRDQLSESYSDARGNDARAVAGIATFHFMQNRSLHLLVRVRHVEVAASGEARAFALVAMAGSPIPGPEALAALRGSLYAFDVRLREEDGSWRVTSAQWEPAKADDFR
jgi:hypothetical protein